MKTLMLHIFLILAIAIMFMQVVFTYTSNSTNHSSSSFETSVLSSGTVTYSQPITAPTQPTTIPWKLIFDELRDWVFGLIGAIGGLLKILEHWKKKKTQSLFLHAKLN
jgi:hypothetical protein